MRDTDDRAPRITAGPRLDAVLRALRRAETALEGATLGAETAHTWTREQLLELLTAIRDLYARLLSDPGDRSLFEGFEGLGPSRAETDTSLIDAVIGLDFRIGDLEGAESALLAVQSHLADLDEVFRTEHRAAALAPVTERLFDAADRVVARLGAGEYLSSEDLDAWDDAMADVEEALGERSVRDRILTPHRWWSQVSTLDQMINDVAKGDARNVVGSDAPDSDAGARTPTSEG